MTNERLKQITEARMISVKFLIEAEDWFWASYTMAMALECALKAMICKTLNLKSYPEDLKNEEKIVHFFWTHQFEQLLVLSGLKRLIGSHGRPEVFQNWSEFTKVFSGNWPAIRYNYQRQQEFNETKTRLLYKNLIDNDYGLITKIKGKW